jgi:type 1 glutamine amidotransferase
MRKQGPALPEGKWRPHWKGHGRNLRVSFSGGMEPKPFWISDFGLKGEQPHTVINPKSKI